MFVRISMTPVLYSVATLFVGDVAEYSRAMPE